MTFHIISSPAKNCFASTTVFYVYNITLVAISLWRPSFHRSVMIIWFLQVWTMNTHARSKISPFDMRAVSTSNFNVSMIIPPSVPPMALDYTYILVPT